jgi:hypothetical protein
MARKKLCKPKIKSTHTMKIKILILSIIALACTAHAQRAGVFPTPWNGGTNNIAGASTNYPVGLVTSCTGYASVGVSFNYSAINTNATNGNLILKVARSYDNGNTFETIPFFTNTVALPAASAALAAAGGFTNTACLDVPITNATHVAIIEVDDTGASAANVTNVAVKFVLAPLPSQVAQQH